MNFNNNWKIKYAIMFIIATIIIYGSFIFIYGDSHEVIHYVWLHLGFIPLDLLLLTLIIEELLSKKESEILHEKMDMIVGSFFSEMGNDLIIILSSINLKESSSLNHIQNWQLKDFDKALRLLKEKPPKLQINLSDDEKLEFLTNLKEFLINEKSFIINLISNSNLLEKEEFSALILATLHLCDELEHRDDLSKVKGNDFNHIVKDMNRVYGNLVYEWIRYLRHLKKHYPYLISIAIRTNPFDKDASIYVEADIEEDLK